MDKNTIETQALLINKWSEEVKNLEVNTDDLEAVKNAYILVGKIQGMQEFIIERKKLF